MMNEKTSITIICAGCFLFFTGLLPCLHAQNLSLSLEDAVTLALENNKGMESANWDWLISRTKAEEAKMKMLPSLSLSAGYQKLSELPPASIDLGPYFEIPEPLTNIYTFSANLQYPVFAGFRLREATMIASLQSETKLLALETVKRAIIFEVRRAYWEAVRATFSVQMLKKNLELTSVNRDLTAKYAAQGTVTKNEELAADLRYQKADMDLGDALYRQRSAYLVLAALTGYNTSDIHFADPSPDTALPFSLTTAPGDALVRDFGENPDEAGLIAEALSKRPETRLSALSMRLAEHGRKLAEAGLYPTIALTGNYTYADPNQRVVFQTDPALFTGTWAIGIQVIYNIGGLPATLKEIEAQGLGINKTQSETEKQKNTILLDVRTCLLNLARTRRDLTLTKGMVDQAAENLRVVQQKVDIGMAGNADLLNAQLQLLQAKFAVTNKQIDLQIASSDLSRALAFDDVNENGG